MQDEVGMCVDVTAVFVGFGNSDNVFEGMSIVDMDK